MPDMGRGIIAPANSDNIVSGAAEMRTLASTAATALDGLEASTGAALAGKASTAYVNALAAAARFTKGRPGDADAFTLPAGVHTISSGSNAARVANMPEEWAGQLVVLTNENETTKAVLFYPYDRAYYWLTVTRNATGVMGPWRKMGTDPVVPGPQHSTRQTAMMHAMGGPIDTGGLGAVAWRIDHGLANFKAKLLPMFRAAGIVPMIAYNPRDWGRAENSGVTAAELNQWVADGWVEIANHGAHHSAAENETALYDTIVNGKAEIEAELPAAAGKVWGFAPPGVSGGDYMGFGAGSTPEQWDTYAGRLIRQHHAVGYGYMSGTQMRVLDGTIRDGLNHVTIDSASVSAVKTRINEAIAGGFGVQLMLHPSLVDTEGRITTSQVQQIVDYIVQQRDAGEVLALSSYQMMVADATIPAIEAPSWDDVTGKPVVFPPESHTHDDRYYTEAEVDAKVAAAKPYDSGPRRFTPTGGIIDPGNTGSIILHRVGQAVYCRIDGLLVAPGALDAWLWPNGIPTGFTIGEFGLVVDVTGGYTGQAGMNGAVRHRLTVYQNDLRYVGYLHGATATTVEASRADQTRRIYGWLPAWMTPDPIPTTLPGIPA